MKINNIAKYSTIISALSFFIYSTVKLIGFGVSQNAIKITDSEIIKFVISNYKDINVILILSLFVTFTIILVGYFVYFSKNNQKITKYLIIALLIGFLLSTISELSRFISFLDFIPLKADIVKIILTVTSALFAISMLSHETNRKKALLIIAPLYIIQNIFIFSTIYLPVQLLDLTFAIRIAESVFFHQENSS